MVLDDALDLQPPHRHLQLPRRILRSTCKWPAGRTMSVPIEKATPTWLGPIRQTAFVVDDIDAAAQQWVDTHGVGPWFLYDVDIENTSYRGTNVSMRARMGLAQCGEQQIELIQPNPDTPSIYNEFLESGGTGVHHVCYWADIRQAVDHFQACGPVQPPPETSSSTSAAAAASHMSNLSTHKARCGSSSTPSNEQQRDGTAHSPSGRPPIARRDPRHRSSSSTATGPLPRFTLSCTRPTTFGGVEATKRAKAGRHSSECSDRRLSQPHRTGILIEADRAQPTHNAHSITRPLPVSALLRWRIGRGTRCRCGSPSPTALLVLRNTAELPAHELVRSMPASVHF
jgi:hypothetical protein